MLKFLLPLVLTCATAIAADEYELRMERPRKAGDRMSVSGSRHVKNLLEIKVDDQIVKNERVEVDLQFEVEQEVLAVNEVGKPVHSRMKISKITGTYNGAPATQFKAGDLVETKVGDVVPVTLVNCAEATTAQTHLARALPRATYPGLVTNDDAYGPGRKVKVGDEWPVNAATVAKHAAESGLPELNPEGIKGTAKLIEIRNREGQPCLNVRGLVEFSGKGMPVPHGPPEVIVSELSGNFENDSDFPVDTKLVVPRNDANGSFRMTAAGDIDKDGRKLRIEMKAEYASRTKEQIKRLE